MRCSGCGLDRKLYGSERLCTGCWNAKHLRAPGVYGPTNTPDMTSGADRPLGPSGRGAPPGDQTEQDRWRMRGEVVGLWIAGKLERMLRWVR